MQSFAVAILHFFDGPASAANIRMQYSIFWSVLFLALAPLGLTIVKMIYRLKPAV